MFIKGRNQIMLPFSHNHLMMTLVKMKSMKFFHVTKSSKSKKSMTQSSLKHLPLLQSLWTILLPLVNHKLGWILEELIEGWPPWILLCRLMENAATIVCWEPHLLYLSRNLAMTNNMCQKMMCLNGDHIGEKLMPSLRYIYLQSGKTFEGRNYLCGMEITYWRLGFLLLKHVS